MILYYNINIRKVFGMSCSQTLFLSSMRLLLLALCLLLTVLVTGHKNNDKGIDFSKVLIVYSHGDSGSSFLMGLMQNSLIGNHSDGFYGELLSGECFDDPIAVVQTFIKSEQKKNPKGIVGFKWKPYCFQRQQYHDLMKWVADNQIKVIYNVRNPLDVIIGHAKRGVEESKIGERRYNCHVGDDECVKLRTHLKVHLKTNDLIKKLTEAELENIAIESELRSLGVNFYFNHYEDLSFGPDEKRLHHLQLLSDFIGVLDRPITMAQFKSTKESGVNYDDSSVILNYDEVVKILTGTRFSVLLHTEYLG